MLEQIPDEIALLFGISLVAPLGGRLNKHWLVERKVEKFVLRRWAQPIEDIEYEVRLSAQLERLGLPVPTAVKPPILHLGYYWSLMRLLDGEPSSAEPCLEQRNRGRLLAEYHSTASQIEPHEQRLGWRRCEDFLSDDEIEKRIIAHSVTHPEVVKILMWHLDHAKNRFASIPSNPSSEILVHGDFTQWNLLFRERRLSGILDFELAHLDNRLAEFFLAWRGKYDEVVYGYNELSPLRDEEWELITPLWWGFLIEIAINSLQDGVEDDWAIQKLLVRSPLMGRDSIVFPGL